MHGMKGLSCDERLAKLNWSILKERVRILTYQPLHNNTELNLNTWHRENPLSQIEGPAGSVRANEVRLNPPIKYNCKQRENFFTSRIEAPLRGLPVNIMSVQTVNIFKNAYDDHKDKLKKQQRQTQKPASKIYFANIFYFCDIY